jgi:hypothetical protein
MHLLLKHGGSFVKRKLVRLVENLPFHFRHSNRSGGEIAD